MKSKERQGQARTDTDENGQTDAWIGSGMVPSFQESHISLIQAACGLMQRLLKWKVMVKV